MQTQTSQTLRPELAAFAELQERVLKANDHKGGWQTMTVRQMMWRLHEEVLELHDVAEDWDRSRPCGCREAGCPHTLSNPDPETVCVEAADVADFAMFIANCVAKRSGIALEDVQP